MEFFYAALCLNFHIVFFYNIVIKQIFCDAADRVSAYAALAAVNIEHTHFRVYGVGRQYKHNAVAADSRVSVG